MSTLAQRITEHIDSIGIKQKFISEKTGINKSSLSSKLLGKTKMSTDEFILICQALNKPPNAFLEAKTPQGV